MTDNPAVTPPVRPARAARRFSQVSPRAIAAEAPSLMMLYPVHVETQP